MKTLSILIPGSCLSAAILIGFGLRSTLNHTGMHAAQDRTQPSRSQGFGVEKTRPRAATTNPRVPSVATSGYLGASSWDTFLAELATLAEDSPDAAERQALALAGTQRDEGLAVLTVAFGRKNSGRSLRMAEMIDDPSQRLQALSFALAQHAKADPDAVFARLTGGEESEESRAQLERHVLAAMADLDPERVVDWLAREDGTAASQLDVLYTTVQRWAQKDPTATATWIAEFKDEQLLPASVNPLITAWTEQDAAAPAAWIESLPEGTLRDHAAAAYALAGAVEDPESARQWAFSIHSAELKASTLKRLDAVR